MTREELFPPRTLADALTYYADADFNISGVTSVPITVIEIL